MPITVIHDLPIKEKMPLPGSELLRWKVDCQNCDFVMPDLLTGNGAEAVAKAHSVIHGHDVEYTFSVIDCFGGVIRARDPRD